MNMVVFEPSVLQCSVYCSTTQAKRERSFNDEMRGMFTDCIGKYRSFKVVWLNYSTLY